jgi:Ig-like domain CHU_C associated/HYR domain/Secretion system C-terminal sorting domain/FG-GAP-like repeat
MKHFSVIAALTSLLISNYSFAQNSCFSSLSDYSFTAVTNARCIEKGDFNGDGNQDVVVGNYTTAITNQIAVLLGDGTGGFSAPVLYTAGRRPQAIKAYDFNGDSNLDLAVVNNFDHNVAILFGTGTGTFGAPTTYTTGTTSGPNDIDLGDFDEDGIMDLVVSVQATSSGFAYLRGLAGGTFAANVNSSMGTTPRSVTVGDFNGDSNLDVATANNGGGNVSVRLGTGTGTFGAATTFAAQAGPFCIKTALVTSDGFLDLVVSNATTGSITLLVGNGAGSFAAADNYTCGLGPNELVINDFDENGELDVAVVNNAENTVSLFKGTGTDGPATVFMTPVKFAVIGTPQGLIDGDFNNDSNLDLVVPPVVGSRMVVMLGNGLGSFNTGENIATGTGPNGIALASFNGDAFTDLVVANKTSNTISFLAGNGDGTYDPAVSFATGTSPVAIYAADVNGDLFIDVITANSATHNVSVLLGNGAGGFSAPTNFASGGLIPSALVCKDFDGDTDIDIAVANEGSNDFGILLGNGAGSFAAATMFAVGTTPKGIVADNFNTTDAFLDVAVSNFGSNNITVWMGDGAGSFTSSANYTVSNGPLGIASGDISSDGKSDIVVASSTANRVSYLKATGTSTFGASTAIVCDLLPQAVVVADFNNDAKLDVAACNRVAAGSPGSVSVFMGDGTNLGAKTDFTTSNYSISITSGFIDSGTLIDLAVVNFDANNASILLNKTAVITPSGPTTFCSGSSVDLTSSAGNSYTWSPSGSTQTINVTTSGTYNVTVSNLSGLCSSQSNDVIVTVNPMPSILSITGTTNICTSASTSLTANGSTGTLDIDWYDAPTGGTLLSTTASYTTPVLVSTTTYYVAAVEPGTGCVMSPRFPVTVTVGDAVAPVITGMPSNITLSAGASCNAVATWTAPSATDNCSLVSFTPNFTSGSTFPVGVTTVIYTATDASSNVSTGSFTVTVNDVTNPTISGTPATINMNVAAGTCARTVTWTAATASDNCSGVILTCSHVSGSSFPEGTTVVTYTATDASGNVTTTNFNINITDNILPTISGMPSNQTLSASAGTCGAVATWTTPTANDNCGILTFTPNFASGSTFPVGVTTVTYTATDVNGNVATANFTITVNDTQLPTISGTPANINANTGAGTCTATVTWTAPTAADNCTVSSFVPSNAPGSSFPVGVTTVTYTATDASGNVATSSFTVTVTDNIMPSFTGFPSNISLVSSPGLCSNTATWTAPTSVDNCAVLSTTSTNNSGDSFPVGVTTVTYTVTDVNGNVTNQSFTVTVLDNEAPVMVGCPTTQTVCEGDTVNYTTPTATDNCSGVTVIQLAGLPSGSVFPVGTTLCTFRATDAAGNLTNCNFNIIVNAAPVASLNITQTNICHNAASLTLTGGSPAGGAYSGTNVSGGILDPDLSIAGPITITYTFTNGSGCSDSATDIITVDDCTGFNELETSNIVRLFPNPTNGLFNLEIVGINDYANTSLTIFNSLGELVHSAKLNSSLTNIDLSALANGMYVVKVAGAEINSTSQLVIQK